jgi:hypothetical protein
VKSQTSVLYGLFFPWHLTQLTQLGSVSDPGHKMNKLMLIGEMMSGLKWLTSCEKWRLQVD